MSLQHAPWNSGRFEPRMPPIPRDLLQAHKRAWHQWTAYLDRSDGDLLERSRLLQRKANALRELRNAVALTWPQPLAAYHRHLPWHRSFAPLPGWSPDAVVQAWIVDRVFGDRLWVIVHGSESTPERILIESFRLHLRERHRTQIQAGRPLPAPETYVPRDSPLGPQPRSQPLRRHLVASLAELGRRGHQPHRRCLVLLHLRQLSLPAAAARLGLAPEQVEALDRTARDVFHEILFGPTAQAAA